MIIGYYITSKIINKEGKKMKTIRKVCIEVLKKYNPNIDIKVFNLLEEGQIKHYYSIDEGEHKSIPNIELLKTINHDDIEVYKRQI